MIVYGNSKESTKKKNNPKIGKSERSQDTRLAYKNQLFFYKLAMNTQTKLKLQCHS